MKSVRVMQLYKLLPVALCVFALIAVAAPSSRDVRLPPPSLRAITQGESQNRAVLSAEDYAAYRSAFRAQEKSRWQDADEAISRLQDQRLLGTLLAQRYLAKDYRTTADELRAWLGNYADHPEAVRIAVLASTRGVPFRISAPAPLKGMGNVDRIGNGDLPESWYHGLSLWRAGNYAHAAEYFARTAQTQPLSDWHRAAGYYWQARALSRTGEKQAAKAALEQAARYPLTFYGMLASARRGDTLRLSAQAPYVPDTLRTHPAVARAAALSELGDTMRAEAELRHLYSALPTGDRPALVSLASAMNLPNLQVRLSRMPSLSEEERIFATFPTPAWLGQAEAALDTALLYAISRQESSFSLEARSYAGATGLMQLMPATANEVWQRSGASLMASLDADSIPESTQRLALSDLHDPRTNMLLGQEYLRGLIKTPGVRDNLVRMLAAYNAGPGMVQLWNKSKGAEQDPLLYIESIPYGETRRYVMQVLANLWVYRTLMGKPNDSLSSLAQDRWPVLDRG